MSEPEFLRATRPDRRCVRWGHPLSFIVHALPDAIERAVRDVDLHDGARVLDFGCAEQPYRELFGGGVTYLGADLKGNPRADVELRPGRPLEVDSNSVALVLSTQVLEHVEDPSAYLDECVRVLEPGGRLVLSTHGLMPLHRDPIDYWRWTSDGLRHLVESAGFTVDRLEGVMGMAATGIQLVQDATILRIPRRLRRPYASVLQRIAGMADRRTDEGRRAENAMVFVVLATRVAA
jgi:SAM-dependent methyltransferase